MCDWQQESVSVTVAVHLLLNCRACGGMSSKIIEDFQVGVLFDLNWKACVNFFLILR